MPQLFTDAGESPSGLARRFKLPRYGSYVAVLLLSAGVLALCSSASAASLISNVAILPAETSFGAVLDCPSISQCTAAGPTGEVVTFNPTAPGAPSATKLAGGSWQGVSCPVSSQCTLVSIDGIEETFDPAAPGAAGAVTIDPGVGLLAVSCPSISQCTAVDEDASWLTFNPTAASAVSRTSLGPRETQPSTISCPSAAQCTEAASYVNTFNPASPGAPVTVTLSSAIAPDAVACPTSTQCTGVGSGGAVTFNPSIADAAKVVKNTSQHLSAVSCPSASQCTAVAGDYAVTFDPGSTHSAVETAIAPGESLLDVSCPSSSQCTADDLAGHELTFRPATPGGGSANESKLARALKACRRLKKQSERTSCVHRAKRRYPSR
jgi:hypothetical protein